MQTLNISIETACQTCAGEGLAQQPHCQLCQYRLADDDPWWSLEEAVAMPCGHLADEHLVETVICPDCRGTGRVKRWISESEWRSIQRRKIVRGFLLLIIGLIPFGLLIAAVLTNRQGACGSWWYGIIWAGLIVRWG
jgi:hypothetical protein